MSLFSKSKEKIEAEKLYSLLSDKTKNFTLDEIKETIRQQGYSEKISSLVMKMIIDNKLPLKNKSQITKEDVLKDLSKSISKGKDVKDIKPNKEDSLKKESVSNKKETSPKKEDVSKKKSLENVSKVSFLKRTKNFFKRIYFFFEDNYYRMIDGISKVIPINKITDGIDKVFPSFILFLLILALLIYLLVTGSFSLSKSWTVVVEVNDPANSPLNDVVVNLKINDKLISSSNTNVFGEVIFRDFKSKKQDVTLELLKTNYIDQNYTFRLNKNNLFHKITLNTDPTIPEYVDDEEERDVTFVENNNQLITTSNLNVSFTCTNPEKLTVPRNTLVSNGRITVNTPSGCGSLRVSVTSNDFSSISNRVIGEDNKVILTRITQDRGKLGFSVKNISGDALPGSDVTVFNNSQSSLFPLDTTLTDLYGLGEFSLEPKQYLITVSKEGYLTHPRKGPLTVVKDNSLNTEVRLFTLQELLNFSCQDSKYSDYCIGLEIDCQNEHLKPFLHQNNDGTCTIGRPGYIDVTLKDKDSQEPVIADITLESRLKNSDQNYSFTEHIAQNTSNYVFDVIDFYDYKVRVINTESKGYLTPDPVIVNNLDTNIVVSLEYSSELNSGKIGVNVKNNSINISNARVYLYREVDQEFSLVSPVPKITNQFGDVNFPMQLANRDYYAYAIHNVLDKEGTSQTKFLDINSFIELSVDIEDIPKTLNLKVNPNISYDINFYDALHNQITEYVSVNVDNNKQYYFTGSETKVYAVVSSQGYTTYQTELMTLIPDQEIFKEITLLSLSSCDNSRLDVLGFYDKSGVLSIDNIDFIDNTLDDEYKVKFKYTSCLKDSEHKYVHLRTGNQIFIEDDYLAFISEHLNIPEIEVKRGYKFSGEHNPDFNASLFNNNYNSDRQYSGYLGDYYKWLEIDFIDLVPDILEFSVNLKFRESPIAPIDYYNLNYRALATKYNQVYSFNPSLEESWNSMPYYPEGYFYAKTNKYQIPFLNTDYIYRTKLKDENSSLLEPYYDGFSVSIDGHYKYDLEYLYLKDNFRSSNILQTSEYTNNNLRYLSYGYFSSLGESSPGGHTSQNNNQTVLLTGFNILPRGFGGEENNNFDSNIYTHINVDDVNYSLENIDAERGYSLNKYTLFKPEGFFENTNYSSPRLSTNILSNFPIVNTNIYSYYSNDFFTINILTESPGNKVYIGENNLSFKVLDNYGEGVSNILIKYSVAEGEIITLGSTDAQGFLENQEIFLPVLDVGNTINFYFIFSPEYGFSGNTITRDKEIESGLLISKELQALENYYYTLNGSVFFLDLDNQDDYILSKYSQIPLELQEVSFIGNTSVFNKSLIDENIVSENSLPKPLEDNTSIFTNIYLKDGINSSGRFNNIFRNFIYFDQDSPIFTLDVNSSIDIINLGTFNFTMLQDKAGYKYESSEDVYYIELIEDVASEVNLDLNINSTSSAVLESVDIYSNDYIDIDLLDNSFNQHLGSSISSSGILIPLNFSINESASSFPDSYIPLTITYTLSLEEDREVNYTQNFKIRLFKKDSVVTIEEPSNIKIYCAVNACNQSAAYDFKKNVSLYHVILEEDVSLEDNTPNLTVSNFSSSLNLGYTTSTRSLTYSSNYDQIDGEGVSGTLQNVFKFKISDNSFTITSGEVSYDIDKIDSSQTESDLDFDYCVGVGYQETTNNLFILGYCEDQEESCLTGQDALPKVFFNWGEETLTGGWTNKCIGDDYSNMNHKYACDSLQMLISIFYKIQNGVEDSFYIKLMNDGISDNLLKDFIDYDAFYINNSIKPTNENIFSHNAVDESKFKITIDGDPNKKTFTPGVYKVTVYGSSGSAYSGSSSDDRIDIRLNKERGLPSSELSVFHYLPFNGNLNKDGTRNGYGFKTENDDILNLTENVDINYSNVNSPVTTLYTYNHNNNNNFKQILDSKGVILDLEKLNNDYTLKYSPSYPVPIYAHAACLLEDDFSYDLFLSNNSVNSLIMSYFLKWNYDEEIISDQRFTSLGVSKYVLKKDRLTNLNFVNLSTMLYLPTYENISSYSFMLNNYQNNSNTKIFTKSDLEGNFGHDFTSIDFTIGNNSADLQTIKGIFNFIEDEKACINKSPTRTYVKWVDQEVNFTEQELETILENINNLNYICQEDDR